MCAKNYEKLLRADKVITTKTVYGFWATLYITLLMLKNFHNSLKNHYSFSSKQPLTLTS